MDLIECNNKNINRHPWELSRVNCLINEIITHHNGSDILDVGCGDSYFDYMLMNKIKNINKFYGIDIYAEKEIRNKNYFVVNDYKKLKNKIVYMKAEVGEFENSELSKKISYRQQKKIEQYNLFIQKDTVDVLIGFSNVYSFGLVVL